MNSKLNLFKGFFQSEKSGGFVLIACTIISLVIANTFWSDSYQHFWHSYVNLSFSKINLNYSVEHWINDGLMAIFFLLVGLEIERELYVGELSSFKNALLPVLAAIGGMIVPAAIHFAFNNGTATASGFGIPMATDIAFALGILSLAGKRVPVSLKIFLTALAIIDDLGAIAVIGIFYTANFSATYFFIAIGLFGILFLLGKLKVHHLGVYIVGGIIMWYCMLQSGVHASISGVLLAFAIPFGDEHKSPSYRLQNFLHYPVAFFILPLFALANTAIAIPSNALKGFVTNNSLGVMLGLLVGKTFGIFGICYAAVKLKIATLSNDIGWAQLLGISILGGIGFTMSIFITNLAFVDVEVIAASKLSILVASFIAAIIGLIILKSSIKKYD